VTQSLLVPGGLGSFALDDLDQFTREGLALAGSQAPVVLGRPAVPWTSNDFRLFYVGRDDVHDILKYVLSRVTVSLYLNMFGYDDDELNSILMELAHDPQITTAYTLDKSQSGGAHEKAILASDAAADPTRYNASFAIGQSATHQISHTKGFVADALVGGEGSTNWSGSGEGTFVVTGSAAPGPGYKAQNNTQSIFTDSSNLGRFQAELISEHLTVLRGGGAITPVAHG